jgi:Icc-related predicted phosphoesterase
VSFGHWSIGYYWVIGSWSLVIDMKVLYTSDLHGETHFYQELLELSIASSAEVVAVGGDLLPSFPPTKRYEDMIPNQKSFVDEFLLPFFKKIFVTTPVKQIFLIPGNWDVGYPYLFREPIEGVIDLSQKIYRFKNGHELIGYPFVPPTPFRPKDYEKMDDPEAPWPPQKNPSYVRASEYGDQLNPIDPHVYLREQGTIREDLNRLTKPINYKKAIYIMHSPPFGTKLDLIQGGKSAGSRSIKTFIEGNQPLLTLHGHIHESPEISGTYIDRIGETLSLNPGQSAWSCRDLIKLHAVTFEMENVEETLKHTYPRIRGN